MRQTSGKSRENKDKRGRTAPPSPVPCCCNSPVNAHSHPEVGPALGHHQSANLRRGGTCVPCGPGTQNPAAEQPARPWRRPWVRLWGRRREDHSTGDAAWRAQNLAGGGEPGGGGDPTFSALGPCCCCFPCTGTRVRLGPSIAQRVSHPSWRAKVSTKEPTRHLRDRRPGLPWPPRAAESLAGCSRDPGLRRGGSWGCGEDRARPAGLQPASQASPLLALL